MLINGNIMKIKQIICYIGIVYFTNKVYAVNTESYYVVARLGQTINTVPKIFSSQLDTRTTKYKKYPSIGIGMGKDWNKYWSSEINVSHNKYRTKRSFTQQIYTTILHLGLLYKFYDSQITPYATIGGGLSFNKMNAITTSSINYTSHNNISPSYYAGVGLQYRFSEAAALDASYKHTYMKTVNGGHNIDSPTLSNPNRDRIRFKMNVQEILFGIKFLL